MGNRPLLSSLIIAASLLPISVHADGWRYSIAAGAQSADVARATPAAGMNVHSATVPSAALPRNNLTKIAVREKFGDPREQLPPVGEPPISRWRYPDYTVYFERDLVIISVANEVGMTR